jgi:hypothetical protein
MDRRLFSLLLCVAALAHATSALAQQVSVTSTTPTTVWNYSYPNGTACAEQDVPDVPARPFLVGPLGQTVLWFAANSNGSYASVGVPSSGPDILSKFQRGTSRGPGCVTWLPQTAYPGSTPASYNTGLWMAAPFTPDGLLIEALVHNEFHGEWTQNFDWCWAQQRGIYLLCDYWSIVSALSTDGGLTFQLRQQPAAPGTNVPAIALGLPYELLPPPPTGAATVPQGMTAQSNILQVGRYYYVLAQQLSPSMPLQDGVCIYRAGVPIMPGAPLTWKGWDGNSNSYSIAVPTSYPATDPLPLCTPVLSSAFRFSWSFNTVLNQLIIIGQDLLQNVTGVEGCPYAPNVSSSTADQAFVYTTATLDMAGKLTVTPGENCLLQIASSNNWHENDLPAGQAYPSLLDPTSPQLVRGDRNFQYSGVQPYLYFTQFNQKTNQNGGYDRDVLRLPLLVTTSGGAKLAQPQQ